MKTQDDQTFKQRLAQSSSGGLLVHNDWSKLLMISDKDGLFSAKNQGDHALGFRRLRRFVDQHSPELQL
jgi:hypothetical protein